MKEPNAPTPELAIARLGLGDDLTVARRLVEDFYDDDRSKFWSTVSAIAELERRIVELERNTP